jgi:hypothetical protein
MVRYIIKIHCTRKKELTFNGIGIRAAKKNLHQSPPDITLGYISCIFPYIKEIRIVYKRLRKITIKRMEFDCEDETDLNEEDFVHFIEVLKRLGFHSADDVKICYCKIVESIENNVIRYRHEEILVYSFTSLEKSSKSKRNKKRLPNRSKYATRKLYVCKNLIV